MGNTGIKGVLFLCCPSFASCFSAPKVNSQCDRHLQSELNCCSFPSAHGLVDNRLGDDIPFETLTYCCFSRSRDGGGRRLRSSLAEA